MHVIGRSKPPVTEESGGTSKGNPNAGSRSSISRGNDRPITVSDKAGAGILTLVVVASVCGVLGWICLGL